MGREKFLEVSFQAFCGIEPSIEAPREFVEIAFQAVLRIATMRRLLVDPDGGRGKQKRDITHGLDKPSSLLSVQGIEDRLGKAYRASVELFQLGQSRSREPNAPDPFVALIWPCGDEPLPFEPSSKAGSKNPQSSSPRPASPTR